MEKNNEKIVLKNIKRMAMFFFLSPIILTIIGKLLVKNNFLPIVQNYEEEKIKIVQSVLYFLGLGVFFFCNGFSDFISKKLFYNKKELYEKLNAYYLYTIIMLSFLNLISITGFLGFLICGNFAWLATFSLINFLSLFSYFPTEKRFKKKFEH